MCNQHTLADAMVTHLSEIIERTRLLARLRAKGLLLFYRKLFL